MSNNNMNAFYDNLMAKSNEITIKDLITKYQKMNVNEANNNYNRNQIDYYIRRSSLDSEDSGASSLSPLSMSAMMSPIGSPNRLQYSPLLSTKIGVSNGNKLREIDLLDERENSKYDFNRNGIEVPLIKADPNELNNTGNNLNIYQLFGSNGFDLSPVSGNLSVGMSCAAIEAKPTHMQAMQSQLYSKMKAKPRRIRTQMFCSFCKNNNETKEMYSTHILKDPEGKTMCPILRRYNCPVCNNGGGDYAHTIRYCPRNKSGQCMPSVIKLLKNSRSSDGKRRAVFSN